MKAQARQPGSKPGPSASHVISTVSACVLGVALALLLSSSDPTQEPTLRFRFQRRDWVMPRKEP